jgi:dihydroanticapsin dehydrogenase
MKNLRGKVYLVTGGAQGIGKSTVERLIDEGAIPVVIDINEEHVSKLKEKILNEKKVELDCFVIDFSDSEVLFERAEEIMKKYKRIDGIVHCAFNFIIKGIDASVTEWESALMKNVAGYSIMVRNISTLMKDGGTIVCVASISGMIAQEKFLTYSACKAAQIQMCKNLSLDLASKKIRLNCVSPGTVWTENNAFFIGRDYGVTREEADMHPSLGGKHILGRLANPEEISGPIVFLLSDDSTFITGQNIVVDGGYTSI